MNGTLLWVEDDANDILLGCRAMQKLGFEPPQIVQDGQEALAYLSGVGGFADRLRHPLPSLILLDLKIPKVSGFEVLKWLREKSGLRRIPVVIFSSSKETGDINRAYDLGANAYLVKAVDFKELLENLQLIRAFWMTANQNPAADIPEVARAHSQSGN
jgi:CheY-like chemotaxis protein